MDWLLEWDIQAGGEETQGPTGAGLAGPLTRKGPTIHMVHRASTKTHSRQSSK